VDQVLRVYQHDAFCKQIQTLHYQSNGKTIKAYS
jgi:hypothetical protein